MPVHAPVLVVFDVLVVTGSDMTLIAMRNCSELPVRVSTNCRVDGSTSKEVIDTSSHISITSDVSVQSPPL